MNIKQAPTRWPFPPSHKAPHRATPPKDNGSTVSEPLTRASMLADVCLVVLWGASIPGLMWLGVAGGF